MNGVDRDDNEDTVAPLNAPAMTAWIEQLEQAPLGAETALLLAGRPELGPRNYDSPTTQENKHLRPLRSHALMESLVARQKLLSHLHAEQLLDLTELSCSYPGLSDFLPTELGMALGVSDAAASGRIGRAHQIVDELPRTFAALHRGQLAVEKAEQIRRLTTDVPAPLRALIERDVLPAAATQSSLQLEYAIKRAILRHDPIGAEERRIQATRARKIQISRLPDEMASIYLISDAIDITVVKACLDEYADLAATPEDTRTADARRVDVLVDLCAEALHRLNGPDEAVSRDNTDEADHPIPAQPVPADPSDADQNTAGDAGHSASAWPVRGDASGTGEDTTGDTSTSSELVDRSASQTAPTGARRGRGIAKISLIVPLEVLQGQHGVCELGGYGPIGATHALRLFTPDAEYTRLVTEPLTGKLIDHNRTRYIPPDWLKGFVKHRDQTCRAPGCHRPAEYCEIDYARPFSKGGKTNAANLLTYCRHHHRGKDGGEHTVKVDQYGDSWWTTPLGYTAVTKPANLTPEPRSRACIDGGPLRPDRQPVNRDLPSDKPPF